MTKGISEKRLAELEEILLEELILFGPDVQESPDQLALHQMCQIAKELVAEVRRLRKENTVLQERLDWLMHGE